MPIYSGVVNGKLRYTIAYYLNGKRQRRMFTSLDDAKTEARLVATKIQNGLQQTNDLRPVERESYLAAVRILEGSSVPLVAAVEEYAECRKRLEGVPLLAAIEEFVRRMKDVTIGVELSEAVAKFLEAKEQDGMSSPYRTQLQSTLCLFAKAFPGPILDVRSEHVDRWLREAKISPVTRNNRLRVLRVFFNYAKQAGFLSKSEPSPADGVKKVKAGDTETEIYQPEEFRRLLNAAPARLIPLLAIGGFAGLRAAEVSRLDWSAVDLDRRIIELRAGQTKTASRRLVPISDNLAAWLSLVEREGPVLPDASLFRQATALARRLELTWPNNVLRHSFISYRLAVIQDANRVALEAGNSAAIIFKHYRELVTSEAAQEWFGIQPPEGWVSPAVRWNRHQNTIDLG
ncbi:MAG: tyrosine-type recombinase/integrase [Verrucomicrobia bacterium]|nr:tyrosine-type recombinase/integrase [Verrucomicrobiota bacterium]